MFSPFDPIHKLEETTLNRRLANGILLTLAMSASTLAMAQQYPDKAIKLVVPYPPGASVDVTARLVGQHMANQLGQPVVVDNRSGASGNIGTEYVARQPGDGYTFVLGTDATHGTNYSMAANPTFHPINDFTPLALAAWNPIVMVVNPDVPAKTVKEYVDGVRAGKIGNAYGSSGVGSPHHLTGELLQRRGDVQLTHVPYRGGGPAVSDVLGGQIPAVFSSAITVIPHIQSGKLRALAVSDRERYEGLPDVPSMAETYEGFDVPSWLAFFAPAGVPEPVAERLSSAIRAALADPEIRAKLDAGGLAVPADTSPAALRELQQRDMETKGTLIREAGITAE